MVQKSHSQPPRMVLGQTVKSGIFPTNLNWWNRRISAINSMTPVLRGE